MLQGEIDRLIEFLPEDQRALAASKVRPTLWQTLIETADLIHGNSSIEIPERPDNRKWVKKVKQSLKQSQLRKNTNMLGS